MIDDGCNSCCHGGVWRQNAEAKMKVLRLQPIWVHRKATTFNGVGTSMTSGKQKKKPMAIRLQESEIVIPGCVLSHPGITISDSCSRHSHEIPKKDTSFVTVPGVSGKARMTKRVRDGSITLDDYDGQSLEVVRQVGTGLFIIGIDHLIYDDCVCNPLLNDFLSSTSTTNLVLTARLEIQRKKILPIVSHMQWSIFRGREIPRNVLQADTIVMSCRLANFEQSSWSTHRRHKFW